jgi:Leucine-rich repeat (LRR) protein
MSQLKALKELYVGGNQLQYPDVEFVIESFPQLSALAIDSLGLTGRFAFRKIRIFVLPVLRLTHISALPDSIAQLSSLQELDCRWNAIEGTIYF